MLAHFRKISQYTLYPLSVILGMSIAFFLTDTTITFLPVHLISAEHQAMVLIFILPLLVVIPLLIAAEKIIPLSDDWKPRLKENVLPDIGLFLSNNLLLRADILVNMGMAYAAGWGSRLLGTGLWPTHSSLLMQLILFLVLAEFTWYWYHRLSHSTFPLWRFHSVHHNPRRLYWFNGTRFHYVDMVILPLIGNLPAIFLGAPMSIIMLGTVFSIIHGMWQHANADVRFGVLNYVLSSPQLHRWHHSRVMKQANTNYGNNLIIWDIVFKTRYLPKQQQDFERVGVSNMSDQGVVSQLLIPVTLRKHPVKQRPTVTSEEMG